MGHIQFAMSSGALDSEKENYKRIARGRGISRVFIFFGEQLTWFVPCWSFVGPESVSRV